MSKRWLGLIVVLVIIFISGCGGGGGPTVVDGAGNGPGIDVGSGVLTGRVYDSGGSLHVEKATGTPTGASVQGATVTVEGTSASATTDANGIFTISNLSTGSYTITVARTGYSDLHVTDPIYVYLGWGTQAGTQATHKAWNFLVYLDADNNLESYAVDNINQMEQVGSDANVNILVLVDRTPGEDTTNGQWTNTRLYYITRDSDTHTIHSELLAELGERDMSDPNLLKTFVEYCDKNFPADHTVLDLWDHGGGVYPREVQNKKQFAKSKGICWDDTTGSSAWNCLTTDQVALTLSQARAATGRKIDIIAMDACLMQMLEVAYEWRDEGYYLVGSEANIPGSGFNYTAILQHLANDPGMTTPTYVGTLVTDYQTYYDGIAATTLSALDLGSKMTDLMVAFNAFADELNGLTDFTKVKAAYSQTNNFDSASFPECRDLYSFADGIVTENVNVTLTTAASNLKTAIEATVLSHAETGAFVNKASGLSILLPNQTTWSSYYNSSDRYLQLQLSEDTNWDEFIVKFVATNP